MKRHLRNNSAAFLFAAVYVAAVALPPPLHASEYTISEAASVAQPVTLIPRPPANSGPLRVVIPNIKTESHGTPGGSSGVSAKPANAPAIARAPVAAPSSSRLEQISQRISDTVEDAWYNGVSLVGMGNEFNEFIVQKILKPNIPFLPMPSQWALTPQPQTPQFTAVHDADAMASLTPAAGGSDPQPIPALIPQTTSEVTVPTTSDATEPAPSLSSQSKEMITNVPKVRDTQPEKPFNRKVDIARAKPSADVLNKGAAPSAGAEKLGIKPGGVKNNFDVNYELERAYNALVAGQSETAMQIYEDILTSNPKNKDALFGLAGSYHRVGQIDMARSLYGKLLELDPKHRDGLNNFLVLLADEAPGEALGYMERMEQQNPDFSPIPAQMAIIYQKLGDHEKATDKMYRALAISPQNMTYRYNLAIMLDRSGKYQDASSLYSQLLEASAKGEPIPGDATKIQQRLTFIRSNTIR